MRHMRHQRRTLITQSVSAGFALVALMLFVGCAPKKQETPMPDLAAISTRPLPPEKTTELLGDVGANWLYGEGLGSTAITVGTIVVFPPYALLVAGNAVLALSGYETVQVSDILPESSREDWRSGYAVIASGPGRLSAALAGREFVTEEAAREKLSKYYVSEPGPAGNAAE